MRQITADFYVSPQILPEDLAGYKEAGIRSIICNRPDGEEAGQPEFARIEAAAQALGLETAHVPLQPGGLDAQTVDAFRAAVQELPAPVLAFCKSGGRSTSLWTVIHFDQYTTEELAEMTTAAGYDMRGLINQLERSRGS